MANHGRIMGLCKGGNIVGIGPIYQTPNHRQGATFAVGATLDDGTKVVAKNVSGIRLANEIAAAWVAGKIGLMRVAEVRLVDDPQGLLQSVSPGFSGRCYASVFSTLPQFHEPSDVFEKFEIPKRGEFHEVIVFDVMIANKDRQNQNLLWSPSDAFIFDHDQAFTGLSWTPATLKAAVSATPLGGMFEANVQFADQSARAAILALAAHWAGKITTTDADELDELVALNVIDQPHVDALKAFIVSRSENLSNLVQAVLDRNLPLV